MARRRYLLATEQHRRDIHSTLAHYYLGTWSRGLRKPFRYSTKQLRCVSGTGKSRGRPRKLDDEADRLVIAKFHYTGPTGPDQTRPDRTRVSDKVRGLCLVGSSRAGEVEFSYQPPPLPPPSKSPRQTCTR